MKRGERGEVNKDGGDKSLGGGLCSCFHLKLDSDHNVSSSLCSLLSLVSLEGFPLSPFEETTAPAGNQRNNQETAFSEDKKHTEVTIKTKLESSDASVTKGTRCPP